MTENVTLETKETTAADNRFRVQASHLAITYPQCPISPEDIGGFIRHTLGHALAGCLCVRENHADGSPHVHVYVHCRNKLTTRRQDFFDYTSDTQVRYHPNFKACSAALGGPKGWTKYILKDGPTGEDIYNFNVDLKWLDTNYNEGNWDQVSTFLIEGKGIEKIWQEMPAFFAKNARSIDYAASRFEEIQESLSKPPWPKWTVHVTDWIDSQEGLELQTLLNGLCHSSDDPGNTPFRGSGRLRRNLYLWGPPGIGKSFLRHTLACYCNVAGAPAHPDQDRFFIDDFNKNTDILVFDEWRSSSWPAHVMNSVITGDARINKKGSSVRNHAPFVIVLANRDIEAAYQGLQKSTDTLVYYQAFRSRFAHVLQFKKPFHLTAE